MRQKDSGAILIQRVRIAWKLRGLADAYEATSKRTSTLGNDGVDDIISHLNQMLIE